THEIVFAGDQVGLSGQLDVPENKNRSTHPLLFVIHHAAVPTREGYTSFAGVALECNYAVFRLDSAEVAAAAAGRAAARFKMR
ncbi:MAG: hypothetical protein UZ15_CFX003001278, partial [Chloroflexi bacterium OLB15]